MSSHITRGLLRFRKELRQVRLAKKKQGASYIAQVRLFSTALKPGKMPQKMHRGGASRSSASEDSLVEGSLAL
eukprot:scaffold685_cov281-Pinguiococcus_pyrenoidosus.AAC.10